MLKCALDGRRDSDSVDFIEGRARTPLSTCVWVAKLGLWMVDAWAFIDERRQFPYQWLAS